MDSFEGDSLQPIHSDPAPRTRRRREADEWSLVLRAEGISHQWIRSGPDFILETAPEDQALVDSILTAWMLERAERRARLTPQPVRKATPVEIALAYALALSLLAWHLSLNMAGKQEALAAIGASDATRVLHGEFWRGVTALTLHSDLAHVAGNSLFGGFFLAILAGRLGIGIALLCFVVTGSLGNYANVLYYSGHHVSIGASTGVFGLVGVVSGLAAWHRHKTAPPGRGAWVAFGAGLGILAMLGTGGPRVDLSAHVFGLVAGTAAGLALALPLAGRDEPPGRPIQALAFIAALGSIGAAWSWGLR